MYFVHPQIKFNNLKFVISSFFKTPDLKALEKELSFHFPGKQLVFTDMGRTAFRLIVEKLNLQNSQMLLPAFICDIFYPILKEHNIEPVFLDIDLKTFNIQLEEIERKITSKTKAILICHTYGLPSTDIEKIKSIYGGRTSVIEDCAQAFGAKKDGKFVGNFGDISFFSLYKQFPTFRGGMLVCPKEWQFDLPKTSFDFRDFISLLNSFPFFAFLFKKFGGRVAPKIIRKEKRVLPSQINDVSLNLFFYFFKNFKKELKNRIELALFFQKELQKLEFEVQEAKDNVFCYLSTLCPKNLNRNLLVKKLRKYQIFCTRIWQDPIILNPEVQKEYKIDLNQFPNTVEAAKRIINFPLQNHFEEKDVKEIIKKLKKTISSL